MKITQLSIKNGVTTAMIYLIVAGFGLFSLARLNVDLYPKLEFPIMAVITQYTGVGPFDLETVVSRPIEEATASVENIKTVRSTSQQGLSLVLLEFNWGTDMNQAEIDVRNSLEFIRDYMPEDASEPMVFAFDVSAQPVLYLTLSSPNLSQAELRYIGEHDLEPRLERIPGVASVSTMGGRKREIKIYADPMRMRAHNIALQQITGALQAANLQIPAGMVENENLEFSVNTVGQFTSVDQIANTAVATYNGSVIRVSDVARVEDGFSEQRQRVWNNGESSVMVIVQRQSDANTVTVCRAIEKGMPRIKSELPAGVHLDTMMDLSDFITRSMSNLTNTAWQAILMTFLVLLFFLRNIRSAIIVAVSIPVSMVATFAVMDQAGLTLNVISMAGLALAIGMLVDNSIVVLESIFRRHDEKKDKLVDAANNGTQEVAMAVTASTLTTIVVFLPVLFVPGMAGMLFRDMAITICFSLTISLIVALTLIPLLSSRWLRLKKNLDPNGQLIRVQNRITGWLDDLHAFYERMLGKALAHKLLVLGTVLLLFVISVGWLFMMGGDFMPQTDDGFVTVTVERSPGTSLEAMEKSMRDLNQIFAEKVEERENIYANFGQGEGMMALFSTRNSSQGEINVKLKERKDRDRSKFEIQDGVREAMTSLPDVDAKFQEGGGMGFSSADITVKIFGHDLAKSEAISNELEPKLKAVEGVVSVTSSMRKQTPELRIDLDRQRIADLGLSTAQIGQVVSTSILGSTVTQFRDGGDEYDVKLQLEKKSRTSKEDLENILIMTPTGAQIPLRALATIDYTRAPREIVREGQERIVTLDLDVSGRDLRGVTADVKKTVNSVAMPQDFRTEIGGSAEDLQESFMYLGIALMVAILLTYMVMASQFESLVDPFTILFTIPLAMIGVALGLILTGTKLSVMALVGVVMLVGIVVNNGIVLVDKINQLRHEGMELEPAIHEAGRVRMRPVLMTAMTTILGMFPLALGLGESGEIWAPMGRSVMGGMIVSTVLTLIIVPIIYYYMEGIGSRANRFRKEREQRRLDKGIVHAED
ncbi:MAG: Swarming motility protein SwrC [bacterium ADurb.Bin431]|nr:MAG: Swarming motility protein SwrC [bacterium ADurb.Bin431]HNY89966.1 efflux RND transporter permease subunit [bacterium]HPG81849.1 efflux RND transporter permease subunit [bacterium]